jgi:hypothetical protein
VLYKTAQASGAQAGGGSPDGWRAGGPKSRIGLAPPRGEVIDAEYVDVDESKKPN